MASCLVKLRIGFHGVVLSFEVPLDHNFVDGYAIAYVTQSLKNIYSYTSTICRGKRFVDSRILITKQKR
jgi:hypothetical protein